MARGTKLLLTQRNTALFLERARIRVEGERIVYDKAEGGQEKVFNIPFANLAVLFLGQGTSLTQSAARLLAEEGVFVAFTGTGGTPLHFGSLTNYQVTEYIHHMYRISSCSQKSLEMAKQAMRRRLLLIAELGAKVRSSVGLKINEEGIVDLATEFDEVLDDITRGESLLSNEGILTKELYAMHAAAARAGGFSRRHGEGRKDSREAVINARLDHGNYLAYGIVGAVLWTLGIPFSLSFLHGKTRAGGLVFDLADIFKDAIVLPIAFAEHKSEEDFRAALLDALQDHQALRICFDFMKTELSRT